MFHARIRTLPLSVALALAFGPAPLLAGGGPLPPVAPLHGYPCDAAVPPLLADAYSGLHGTLEGGALTGSSGAFATPGNEALILDGTDARVVVGPGAVLSTRPSSSVSAWYKGGGSGTGQNAIYGERSSCDFNVFWVGMERRPGVPPGPTFAIFDGPGCGTGGGSWHVLTSPIDPAPGVWHHIAAVLDEASGMQLYLDGALVASNASTATFPGPASGISTIGHVHVPSYAAYWPGHLDDVALFPFALAPHEVSWLATHPLSDLPPRAYDTFCPGDGTGTACPCANESQPTWPAGCRNSTGSGGALRAYGNAAVTADTLSLTASDVPATASGIFFQGTDTASGGAGTALGDGLLCVGGSILRLATKFASGGVAYYPHPGDTLVSVRGAIPAAGATRHYQFWYRNAASFCTSATYNYTNGVTVTWTP